MEQLKAAGVPAGRVLNTEDIYEDPNLNARDYNHRLPHPRMISWRQPRTPWRSMTDVRLPQTPAPLFGQHNHEILGGLLGKSEAEIARLYEISVCSDAPVNPGIG